MFVVAVGVVYVAEQHGTPAQHHAGVVTHAFDGSTGGNMEGKEQRFGIADSSLWTAVTTVTSCGAVNAAFDSLTGIGGLVPTANLSTGEVIFGGVGSGLYYMLLLRPADRLHRRADGRPHARVPRQEDRVAGDEAGPRRRPGHAAAGPDRRPRSAVASPTARSRSTTPARRASRRSLYAYMSQANNNGSAFAGYTGFIQPNAPGNAGS